MKDLTPRNDPTLHGIDGRRSRRRSDHGISSLDMIHRNETSRQSLNSTVSGDSPVAGGLVYVDDVRKSSGMISVVGVTGGIAIFIFGTSFVTAGHVSVQTFYLLSTTLRTIDLARTGENAVTKIVVVAPAGHNGIVPVLYLMSQYFPGTTQVTRGYEYAADVGLGDPGQFEFWGYHFSDEVLGWYIPPNDLMHNFANLNPGIRLWKRQDPHTQPLDNASRGAAMKSIDTLEVRTSMDSTGSNLVGFHSSSSESESSDGHLSIIDGYQPLSEGEIGSSRNDAVDLYGINGAAGILMFGNRFITGVHAAAGDESVLTALAVLEAQREENVVSKAMIIFPQLIGSEVALEEWEIDALNDMKTKIMDAFNIQPIVHFYDYEYHDILPLYVWKGTRDRRTVTEFVYQPRLAENGEYALRPGGTPIYDLQPPRIIEQDPI